MKSTVLSVSVLTLMAFHAGAADTNLSQSIRVERPLGDVARAMQTYYYDTNYHGHASAVHDTNAVPGVSYTMSLSDCTFHPSIGVLWGEMVATHVSTNSTKLELIVRNDVPKDTNTATALRKAVSKTLDQVVKITENKQ